MKFNIIFVIELKISKNFFSQKGLPACEPGLEADYIWDIGSLPERNKNQTVPLLGSPKL